MRVLSMFTTKKTVKQQLLHGLFSYYFLLTLRFVIARVFIHRHHGFFRGALIEELQGERHYLGVVPRFALILIFIGLQSAFEENQTAFLEVFLANFAEPSPGFNVDPFSGFFCLSTLVLPAVADGKAEMGYFFACRGELAFGVLAQTADQLDAV